MAVYFDSAVHTTKLTNNLDPNVELFTWLSYKMRDWASKVGSDYVEVISDHTTWDGKGYNLTPTSIVAIQVNLYSDANRAGTSDNIGGFNYYTVGDDFFLKFYWDPTTQHPTYGYVYTTEEYTITNKNNDLEDRDFIGRPSYVIYSDTPGMRYFYAKLKGKDGAAWATCISEIKSVDKYGGGQPGVDANWVVHSNARTLDQYALPSFYKNDGVLFPGSSRGGHMGEHVSGTPIYGGFMLNRLLVNTQGFKWGLSNDAIVWSGSSYQDFQTAKIDGHDFMCVGYSLWLRTDV